VAVVLAGRIGPATFVKSAGEVRAHYGSPASRPRGDGQLRRTWGNSAFERRPRMLARDQVAAIERFERRRPTPPTVAWFDLTFTVPKAFSMLWALAHPQ